MLNAEAPSPKVRMQQMVAGYWISQAIYAAATFGIADLVKDGPRSAADLAKATGTNTEFLYRLLRALASVGVFAEDAQGKFMLTPMAEFLRSDSPSAIRPYALMAGDEQYRVWGNLVEGVRTGENMFEKTIGLPIFDYLTQHPEKGKIFDGAMTGIHGEETQQVLDAYDFSKIRVLADVGGGNGLNLIAILKKYPLMRGILFDLPQVIERARPNFVAAGLGDRCQLVAGNFFESVPKGADACLMRHIIHDWDDAKSIQILKNCHAALPQDGKLLLVESVIPAGNEPCFAKFLDLAMMLIPGGKERTEIEYRQLYEASGFSLELVVATASEINVVEGRKR